MAASTARVRQPEFIDPESFAAMAFLSQLMILREILLGLQILAAHQRQHGCEH